VLCTQANELGLRTVARVAAHLWSRPAWPPTAIKKAALRPPMGRKARTFHLLWMVCPQGIVVKDGRLLAALQGKRHRFHARLHFHGQAGGFHTAVLHWQQAFSLGVLGTH